MKKGQVDIRIITILIVILVILSIFITFNLAYLSAIGRTNIKAHVIPRCWNAPVCGNGNCEAFCGETFENCCLDCGCPFGQVCYLDTKICK